jgi:hypothetical protein
MRPLFHIPLLLALAIAVPAAAAETRLTAAPASVVLLEGSSNVAAWRCRGNSIDAQMSVATSPEHINAVIDRIEDGNIGVWMARPAEGRFPVPRFALAVPVATFRCGNRVMESDMRRALNAGRYPAIEFTFRQLRGGIGHDIGTSAYRAAIAGDLKLAGVTRNIDVTVTAERLSRSSFLIRAELPLRMSDFGVTPPSALFGAIRARDQLTVHFDLTLEIAPETGRQP